MNPLKLNRRISHSASCTYKEMQQPNSIIQSLIIYSQTIICNYYNKGKLPVFAETIACKLVALMVKDEHKPPPPPPPSLV